MNQQEKLERYEKLAGDLFALLSADRADIGQQMLFHLWQTYGLLQGRIDWLEVPGHE